MGEKSVLLWFRRKSPLFLRGKQGVQTKGKDEIDWGFVGIHLSRREGQPFKYPFLLEANHSTEINETHVGAENRNETGDHPPNSHRQITHLPY